MASSLTMRAAARRELLLRRARRDFVAFCSHCFGWSLEPFHLRWVDAIQEHPRTVIAAAVEHAKTSVVSVGFPIWTLGHNHDARIALVSETATQAQRPLSAIREHIQSNRRLHEVFPDLRPAKGPREKWTDSEIVVERNSASKDPSIIACGVLGPLLGARLDYAIGDDLCSWSNSFTAAQRDKVKTWFSATLVGRMVAGGRVVVVGTPWHPDDLLGALQQNLECRSIRDPAISDSGEILWPEQWSRERLEQRRREIGEIEFSRQMLLEVISDSSSRFKMDWFENSFRTAAEAGAELVERYDGPDMTFTGVDLGVGQEKHHDKSVIFTIALQADGRRRVLNIESGRWQAPDLIQRLRSTWERFRSRIRVESNQAQQYVVHFLKSLGVPVTAHTTTARNKHDPKLGIESMAVEFEQGRWVVPDAPATRSWVRELLSYSPGSHASDATMASWLCREEAREYTESAPLPLPFLTSSGHHLAEWWGDSIGYAVSRPGELPDEWSGPSQWSDFPPFLRG